jgi:hypothetical protein
MSFRWIAGSLLLAAGLLAGAERANAQVCGDLDVAATLAAEIFGYADDFPLLDVPSCAKVAKAGAKACHRTVAQVSSCWIGANAGLLKVGNVACRAEGDGAACSAQHRALFEQIENAARVVTDQQHALCDELAQDFFGDCVAGI